MMNNKNNIIFYISCTLFCVLAIFLIIMSGEIDISNITILLLFGGGGICYYLLDKKENKCIKQKNMITIKDTRTKSVILMFGCLCFVICCFFILPVFDSREIMPPYAGWVVGVIGILFFGYGFIASIKGLIKPMVYMQLSDEGLELPSIKGNTLIAWKDVSGVSINGNFLSIYLKKPDLYPAIKVLNFVNINVTGTNINIPTSLINYNVEQIVNFINSRIT